MDYKDIIKVLGETLPPVFRRTDVGKLTGGVIQPAMLSVLRKEDQPPSAQFGKNIVYERESFLKWAEDYYGQFTRYNLDGSGENLLRVKRTKRGSGGAGEGHEGEGGSGEGAADLRDGCTADTKYQV